MTAPRRLVVTGSESTGKTTLAQELAAHLGVSWVPEQSRRYAEHVARPLTADDVEPIARAQRDAEDEAMSAARERGDPWLVLDTDLVSTVVYARHYYGACPDWIVREAQVRAGDLYLLCDIDLPWVGDSVRDRPLARDEMQESFRLTLRALGVRPLTVSGSGPDRLRSALQHLR